MTGAPTPDPNSFEPAVTLVAAELLGSIYYGIAGAHGANAEEAGFFRDRLLRADLRGHSTQGSALIPYHDEMIASGQMRFGVPLEVVSDAPGVAVVDAHFGVGEVVGTRCMGIAMDKAERTGIGCVTVRNSGDFAMASAYSLLALERGMVGIAMSNGKPVVAPWGGRDPLFCTNPISVAFPGGERFPLVIDMASSAFSMGDAIRTARDGKRLPFVGIVDRDGVYGDDPAPIVIDVNERESKLDGALLPLGPKGFCLLLIVELMCSALAGSAGSYNNDFEPTGERPWDHGQVFMAMSAEAFAGQAALRGSVDALIDRVEGSRPAPGQQAVRVPGRSAHEEEQRRTRDGVPVRDEELAQLCAVARRRGLAELVEMIQ
ncbi:MAG TPA: Ldh family oxidoreductase [Solirubrobacteraceae bacterium]|jgi:LDH2 family malate/lactate/ureidoglycolate dehydrogenase|nr:Ldh family oxidoreductase [Solirubrobacteraceae bacterium]